MLEASQRWDRNRRVMHHVVSECRLLISATGIRWRVRPKSFRRRIGPHGVILEYREVSRIRVAHRGPLGGAVVSWAGYAIIVRFTEGIGPLKPRKACGRKRRPQSLEGDMFLSKFKSWPRIWRA